MTYDPIDSDDDGVVEADTDNEKTTTEQINNVHYADKGEVQSVIDSAAGNAGEQVVKLHPEKEYDEGSQVTVKSGVSLDGNGAVFKPTTDYSILFVENNATVGDSSRGRIAIDTSGVTYTSVAIELDTATIGGNYRNEAGNEVQVHASCLGTQTEGTALKLRTTDGTANTIGPGNTFDLVVHGYNKAVDGVANSGMIGGNDFSLVVKDAQIAVDHRNDGTNTSKFDDTFYGQIQPHSTDSDIAIRSQISTKAPRWVGKIGDMSAFNTGVTVGSSIAITTFGAGSNIANNTDGSANVVQTNITTTGTEWISGQNNNVWSIDVDGSLCKFEKNGNVIWLVDGEAFGFNGSFANGYLRIRQQDLTSFTPSKTDAVAMHDGTDGTNTNSVELARYDGTDWQGIESGTVIK